MNFFSYKKVAVFLFIILFVVSIFSTTVSGNIDKTYTIKPPTTVSHQYRIIHVEPRLLTTGHNQKLYVSTPISLVNYYGNLTHAISENSDYARLITPQAVAPIADALLKVTNKLPNHDEQFADAVLGFVHQMSYNVTNPQYPVEALASNAGDCVGLSLLTASIMEAGGLDVVLILYTGINPQHMNVGVNLPYPPIYHTAFASPTNFSYDNKTYWTAEATPEGDWKVGDQSQALSDAKANIITLGQNLGPLFPAQISASLNAALVPSTITIEPSQQATSMDLNGERSISISGQITPSIPGQAVNVYVSSTNYEGEVLDFLTAVTDKDGSFKLNWNFTDSGTYYITANWNGASNYAAADSQTVPIFVGPQSYFQFSSLDYNYIFGQPGLEAFATQPMQGENNFLTVPLGPGASLSYNFIVMQAGQTISNVPTTNISVPTRSEKVLTKIGKVETIEIPAHNVTVPVSVPEGFEPLMLPDDFNETLDNQFSLILQNNAGNYSLNFKALSQEDISNMQGSPAIANATGQIKENVWYQVTTKISGNIATTKVTCQNGTLIQSTTNQESGNSAVLLLTNNEDTAIALKNLTVQNPNINPVQPETTQRPTGILSDPNLALYVVTAILALSAIAAALYVKRATKAATTSSNH